jgi:hypothetical protein
VVYLNWPDWCEVDGDSIYGIVPKDSISRQFVKVIALDSCNADTMSFPVSVYGCGDVDASSAINVSDVVTMLCYIFGSRSCNPAFSKELGDVNCDGSVDIVDCVYMVNYIFVDNAPELCAGCK